VNILIFAGAGTSVELGVPAMRDMALRLAEHLLERRLVPELVSKFTELLRNAGYDIEDLIEELDHMTSAIDANAKWGNAAAALTGLRVLRQEAEWFVNHVCERVEAESAALLWGGHTGCFSGPSGRYRNYELRPRD
jgi:hypothetical protein